MKIYDVSTVRLSSTRSRKSALRAEDSAPTTATVAAAAAAATGIFVDVLSSHLFSIKQFHYARNSGYYTPPPPTTTTTPTPLTAAAATTPSTKPFFAYCATSFLLWFLMKRSKPALRFGTPISSTKQLLLSRHLRKPLTSRVQCALVF